MNKRFLNTLEGMVLEQAGCRIRSAGLSWTAYLCILNDKIDVPNEKYVVLYVKHADYTVGWAATPTHRSKSTPKRIRIT